MVKYEYFDGIGQIGFSNGAIRLDLYVLVPPEGDSSRPKREVRQRIVLSPQGFVEAFQTMEHMMKKFQQIGLIQTPDTGAGERSTFITSQ